MKLKKRFGFMIALVVLAAAVMLGVIPSCSSKPASGSDPESDSGLKYVAHRGYSHSYVGNSEAAFKAAANLGFYGIETDIRKTKDGYYVCNHDAAVKFDDGSEKTIAKSKRADLMNKNLQKDKASQPDAYLCTFETYLQACKEGGKVAVIELKDYFSDTEVEEILSIVDAEYDRKKVTFISFYYAALRVVQEADPSIPLQYLSQTEGDSNLERCLEDGISADVKYTLLTDKLVKAFHEAKLTVNVWTVNDESILQTAYEKGVDYVTTDVFYEK